MTKEQAVEIVKKIHSLYSKSNLDNDFAREQYINTLTEMDYECAKSAMHVCFQECKFLPTIAEIREKYLYFYKQKQPAATSPTGQRCRLCKGVGIFLVEKDGYDYGAFCPECEAGQRYAYKGQDCKDRKSDYECKPITHYIQLSELYSKRNEKIIIN